MFFQKWWIQTHLTPKNSFHIQQYKLKPWNSVSIFTENEIAAEIKCHMKATIARKPNLKLCKNK